MGNVPFQSTSDYPRQDVSFRAVPASKLAIRFFLLATGASATALSISWLLIRLLGRVQPLHFAFPPAFVLTSLFLVAGSVAMHRALWCIRREKQSPFRRALLVALGIGVMFMGVQSYALWCVVPADRSAASAEIGVAPFVLALAALHAFHFLVANLFLSFVIAQSTAHRYDHEYHWGVTVCTWFWHGLGMVWVAVLVIFLICLYA